MLKKSFIITIFFTLSSYAAPMTIAEIKQQVQILGLDKKMTAKDFLAKAIELNKDFQDAELEELVKAEPSRMMPQLELKSISTPNGDVVVMTFSEDGKITTVQYFGEDEKYLKVNNITLSENDAADPEKLTRAIASQP